MLQTGITNARTVIVTADLSPVHLAPLVVLSTPDMIRLMEEICTDAVQQFVEDENQTTVGTHVDVSHESAATEGEQVELSCELIKIERRRLTFRVEARVGEQIVGQGTHQRHIIDRDRFGL